MKKEIVSREVRMELYCNQGGHTVYKTKKARTKFFYTYYTMGNDAKAIHWNPINLN